MKRVKMLIACMVAGLWFMPWSTRAQTWPAKLDLASLFYVGAVTNNGIVGTVNKDGYITVTVEDKRSQTILYKVTTRVSTSTFAGQGDTLSRSAVGPGGTYFPPTWFSKDIKRSAFAIDRYYYDSVTQYPYQFLYHPVDVNIIVKSSNAQLQLVKIPGIGIVNAQGGNNLFDAAHYCYDLTKTADCQCSAWLRMKQPDVTKKSDLIIAAHRGIWGYDLGNGNPENSISSLQATPAVTPVLESDVMITKDDSLIISHDYNLNRLSDYTGPDTNYLFNMYMSQVSGLQLRKRNEAISTDHYLSFDHLMQALVTNKLVLTIDIKDVRARYDLNGNCVGNCEYDPKTNPKADSLIQVSWKKIFNRCVAIAKARNALSYIAFKVNKDWDYIKTCASAEDLSKILFMPVIQPVRDTIGFRRMGRAIQFVDSWNNKAGNRVIAFETNFKQLNNVFLKPFTWQGLYYQNLLDYVYTTTGLRPGCYPEEPMGPRGIVTRWADWLIKDPGVDMRGDHYKLMSIPYGKIMVLTTDRPDVWSQIEIMYNK
ncbi:glycerophosphodiester phosphodiesterase family protein [Mucilaginibacter terrae]|uniref:glycerophosphodiester phosphodiesterase family protein n=1 Tax=Mucilaginibacter terrae TaxID=1955052 RepID=UPI003624E7FF